MGRQLRATREDAPRLARRRHPDRSPACSGHSRSRARWPGSRGGLYVHFLPISTEDVYLNLTFITLAMLVIGGAGSLWGAVVGALAVSALDSFLAEAERRSRARRPPSDLPSGAGSSSSGS